MTIDLGDYINGIPMGAIAPGSSSGGGGGGTPYVLPPATATTLGGIKVGENLTIESDGTLNAEAGGGSLPDVIDGGNASSPSSSFVNNLSVEDLPNTDILTLSTLSEEVTITE